jgi:hypothetical protein
MAKSECPFPAQRRTIELTREPPPLAEHMSPRKLLIFQPVRDDAVDAEAALFVFLVIGEIPFEPFDVAVALEGEHMRRDAIQEEAVMRDDHRAAGEIR